MTVGPTAREKWECWKAQLRKTAKAAIAGGLFAVKTCDLPSTPAWPFLLFGEVAAPRTIC
jgi:hypothetical protein